MYGEFRWENKYKMWDRMRQLHQNKNLPWIMIGDHNEKQFLHEKEDCNPRSQQYMQAFQNAIDDCRLRDLGFVGDPFTWRRGQIWERLDRGLVNDAWSLIFPNAALENMEFNHLDHRLLFVNTEFYNQPIVAGASGQPKRFEAR